MKVRDLMSKEVQFVLPSDTAQSVAQLLRKHDIGSVPVARDRDSGRLQGIITDRDLCCAIVADGLDPKTTTIERFITKQVISCQADSDAEECARLMQQNQIRRIPVVDDQGRCIGILAQADLARRETAENVGKTVRAISQPTHQQPRAIA